MTELRGMIPITATPFDAEGRVDKDSIVTLVEFEARCGVAAGAAEMYDRYASYIRYEGQVGVGAELRAILERAGILEPRRAI